MEDEIGVRRKKGLCQRSFGLLSRASALWRRLRPTRGTESRRRSLRKRPCSGLPIGARGGAQSLLRCGHFTKATSDKNKRFEDFRQTQNHQIETIYRRSRKVIEEKKILKYKYLLLICSMIFESKPVSLVTNLETLSAA